MKQLQPEGGVTETSLANAKILIAEYGVPSRLDFKADKRACDYFVRATWNHHPEVVFTFTGFAWGYGGTAPAGLAQFLDMAKVTSLLVDDIPMDKYEKTDCSWFRDISKVTASI